MYDDEEDECLVALAMDRLSRPKYVRVLSYEPIPNTSLERDNCEHFLRDDDSYSMSSECVSEDSQDDEWWIYHYEERYRGPSKKQRKQRRKQRQNNQILENFSDLVFTIPATVSNETEESFIGTDNNGHKMQRLLCFRETMVDFCAVPTLQELCLNAHFQGLKKRTDLTSIFMLPSGLRQQASNVVYEQEVYARCVDWYLKMCAHLNLRLVCEVTKMVKDDQSDEKKPRTSKRTNIAIQKSKRKCQFGMLCRTIFSFKHVGCDRELLNSEEEFSRSVATVHATHRIGHLCEYYISENNSLNESWFTEYMHETFINTLHFLLSGFHEEEAYDVVVQRLETQMNHRFPTLAKLAFSTSLPYVHWSHGKLDKAAQSALGSAEECRSLVDKYDRNASHRYCMALLNDIGRMYATFGQHDDAVRFFHAATVEGLAMVSEEFRSTIDTVKEHSQSEAAEARAPSDVVEESSEEIKMNSLRYFIKLHQATLTAAFSDTGYLAGNCEKRATSVERWKQALSVPNVPTRLAVHAAISAVFCHADSSSHWVRTTLGFLDDLMSHSVFVQYYMSILHAMLGNERSSFHFLLNSLEQSVLDTNVILDLSGLQPLSMDESWWRPFIDHVANSGSKLCAPRMMWRQLLCQPMLEGLQSIETDSSSLWQVAERSSESLNLRLDECSAGLYLTADVAGSWPPITILRLNPWTGEHLLLKDCSRLAPWQNKLALTGNCRRRDELAFPYRLALGKLTTDGSLVELFCAGECCTFEGRSVYDDSLQLNRNPKLRRGWMELVVLSKTGLCRRIDIFRVLDKFRLQEAEKNMLSEFENSEEKMSVEQRKAKIAQFKRIVKALAHEGRSLEYDDIKTVMKKEDEARAQLAKLTNDLAFLRTSKSNEKVAAVQKSIRDLKQWLSDRKWLDCLSWNEYVLVDVTRVHHGVVLHVFWSRYSSFFAMDHQNSFFHVFVQLNSAAEDLTPCVVKLKIRHLAKWQILYRPEALSNAIQFFLQLEHPTADIVALPNYFSDGSLAIYHTNGSAFWDFENSEVQLGQVQPYFFHLYSEFGGAYLRSSIYLVLQCEIDFPELRRVVALEKDRCRRSAILLGIVRLSALCQASTLVVFFKHGWSMLNAAYLEHIVISDETTDCRAQVQENNCLVPLLPYLTLGEDRGLSPTASNGDERHSCFVAEERLLERRLDSNVVSFVVQAAVVMRKRLWVVEVQLLSDAEVVDEQGSELDNVFPLSTQITILVDAVGRITEVKFVPSVCIIVCCTPVPLSVVPSFAGAELLCQYSWIDGTLLAVLPGLGNAPHNFLHAELPFKNDHGENSGGHMIFFSDGHGAICALQLS